MLSNLPYGKSWENDQKILGVEKKGSNSTCNDPRFSVGITSKSDGQMMFLLNMLSKMKFDTPLGFRIASVHNGSSLFNSDGGMVAIRKYIIENDYLEAIIALPTNMFYNTGIPLLLYGSSPTKSQNIKGKVWLINATNKEYFSKMKKSLGSKQNEITKEHIERITKLFLENATNKDCKIYDNEDFGYTKITLEKPKSIEEFIKFLGLKLKKTKKISSSIAIKLTIPLKTDIQSYYDTEVKSYVKNSWIAWSVGYEILFNKYFYTYTPPRKLKEINSELEKLEKKCKIF